MSFYSLTSYSQLRVNILPLSSGGGNLLLDQYPGSSVAYSLRKLSSSFSGSPIRVRRDNDNQEQDIPFDVNGDLDTTNLTDFVGSGNNGFVVKWYDQSGNGNDAYMNTATNQAQIVRLGSFETDAVNGKVTTNWLLDAYNLTNTITTTLEYYLIIQLRRPTETGLITLGNAVGNAPRVLSWEARGSGNSYRAYMDTLGTFGSSSGKGTFLIDTYRESDGDMFLYRNNIQQGVSPNMTDVGSSLTRWGRRGSVTTSCEIQEMIYWPDSTYTDRASIYTNLDTYY